MCLLAICLHTVPVQCVHESEQFAMMGGAHNKCVGGLLVQYS